MNIKNFKTELKEIKTILQQGNKLPCDKIDCNPEKCVDHMTNFGKNCMVAAIKKAILKIDKIQQII